MARLWVDDGERKPGRDSGLRLICAIRIIGLLEMKNVYIVRVF